MRWVLMFQPQVGRAIVGRRADMGEAHATHDVLDHIDAALAAIDMYRMFRLAPVSPCVLGHLVRSLSLPVPEDRDRIVGVAALWPMRNLLLRYGRAVGNPSTLQLRPELAQQ